MAPIPTSTARDCGQHHDRQYRDSQYRDGQYREGQHLLNQSRASQYHASQYQFGQEPTSDRFSFDIEQKGFNKADFQNTTVHNFAWQGVTVIVNDRKTKEPKVILDKVNGMASAGM